MAEKKLTYSGFRTMAAWIGDFIKQLFSQEADKLHASVYPVVGMCYVGSETNVQALSQFGIEGNIYFLGDANTEDTTLGRPVGAMYYMEGSKQVFITTEDGEYIETTPLNGSKIEVIYSSEMTYLGGKVKE